MGFLLLFAILVLLSSTLLKAILKHYSAYELLKDYKHFLADTVGVILGLIFYTQIGNGLFDWDLLKDLALGYLIAIRTFDYVYKYIERWLLARLL